MRRYYFNNSKNYIDSHEQLSKEQIEQLNEIMTFFHTAIRTIGPKYLCHFNQKNILLN